MPARILAAVTVGYALSPVDPIPGCIPVPGCPVDLPLLPLLTAPMIRLIPQSIFAECERDADSLWKSGRPKRLVRALPVVDIWLLLLSADLLAICH